MSRNVRAIVASLVLLTLPCPRAAEGQTRALESPSWEVAPYVGIARARARPFLHQPTARERLFVGVHVTARLLDWRGLTLAYAPELVPLLLVSENPTYRVVSSPFGAERVQTGVANVAGFGLSPVGFEGRLRLSSRVRLHAATASGVVVFTRAAPTPDARRVNFTFEFGGGCDLALRAGWWLRVAAKRHHFSNANSARDNPGVDATVVTVGLARGIGTR